MPGVSKKCLLAAILVSVFSFSSVLQAEVKTLDRVDDPVVMECKEFAPLFGAPMDQLALMARHGEAWTAIPFQIDQKKPDGSYAFTHGPEAGADPDPNLDANDELVFMVKDTGDSSKDGKWPEGAQKAVEIETTDPGDNTKGWTYLVSFSRKAPRSDEDYIQLEIDDANNYHRVKSYEYVMGGPIDRIYPDLMAASELPDGRPGLDIVNQLKITGKILLIGGFSLNVDFGAITKAENKGYIDGPVRVLILTDAYMQFAGFIKVRTQGYLLISYYVNHAIWPMSMDVPINDLGLIRDIKIYGYMDFNSNVYGSYPFNEANPYDEEVVLDGTMSDAEKNLDRETEITWSAGFGPQGALVVRLYMIPKFPGLKQVTYYVDDSTLDNPLENSQGLTGVGYEIQGFEVDPDKPTAVSNTYYYHLGKLKPEEVHRILDILDHPLEVSVKTD